MANLVSRKAKGSSATADMKRRDLAFWTRRLKALPRNKEAQRKRREGSDDRQASFNLAPYKAMNN